MKRLSAVLLVLALLLAMAPMAMAEEDMPDQGLKIKGDAYYDAEQDIYVLTEEKVWQSGALWFDQVRCIGDLVLELDFYTGHGHETNSYGGADGI